MHAGHVCILTYSDLLLTYYCDHCNLVNQDASYIVNTESVSVHLRRLDENWGTLINMVKGFNSVNIAFHNMYR